MQDMGYKMRDTGYGIWYHCKISVFFPFSDYLYPMQLEIPFHLENYIGGHFIGPLSGTFIDNMNPATGEVYGQVPDSNFKDIDVAVQAAQKACKDWSSMALEKRFLILNRIAELIDEHMETLALAETNDNGKPLWLSKKVDIYRAAANFRFFATGLMHI